MNIYDNGTKLIRNKDSNLLEDLAVNATPQISGRGLCELFSEAEQERKENVDYRGSGMAIVAGAIEPQLIADLRGARWEHDEVVESGKFVCQAAGCSIVCFAEFGKRGSRAVNDIVVKSVTGTSACISPPVES